MSRAFALECQLELLCESAMRRVRTWLAVPFLLVALVAVFVVGGAVDEARRKAAR